jgi:DNA-binding response OmpR family regulator
MIVEDESIVAIELATYVRGLGYDIAATVSNARDAFAKVKALVPDIVLMDVHLKGDEDGISLAERIVEEFDSAIIYITAFTDDESIERAVATEPVAYLAKPFNRRELAAALQLGMNRVQARKLMHDKTMIHLDDEFSVDMQTRQLFHEDAPVKLTRQEAKLLELLIEASPRVVDIYTVENTIWPTKTPNDNTRRGLVSRLRTKLKQRFIETYAGQGYVFKY